MALSLSSADGSIVFVWDALVVAVTLVVLLVSLPKRFRCDCIVVDHRRQEKHLVKRGKKLVDDGECW
jgi:hypothetical protein